MKSRSVYLCNTPKDFCNGGMHHGTGWQRNHRFHPTRVAASKCYRDYLTSKLGYKKVGSNQYAPPDGGPVILVGRPSRYGAKLKREVQKGAGRYVADDNHGAVIG